MDLSGGRLFLVSRAGMISRLSDDQIKEVLKDPSVSEETKDLAHDILITRHALHAKERLAEEMAKKVRGFEVFTRTRWRELRKTTPSGKTVFVCLGCGRQDIVPTKTCPEPVVIASGGTAPSQALDCETAYQRRPY